MTYRYGHASGFSLVETLVAITVLLVLIVGPMSVVTRSSSSASLATEQSIAYFLAQEGAELAQKARDDLLLSYVNGDISDPWGQFIDPVGAYDDCIPPYVGGSDGCGLTIADDADGSVVVRPCTGTDCRLYRNDGSGDVRARYVHNPDLTPTPYTRTITLEPTGTREVKVTSVVSWRTGSIRDSQSVTVETYLFNLYDTP